MCKNGHPDTERVRIGDRWRCQPCVKKHQQARAEREKAGLVTKHRHGQPVCQNGCIRVCLCEEL